MTKGEISRIYEILQYMCIDIYMETYQIGLLVFESSISIFMPISTFNDRIIPIFKKNTKLLPELTPNSLRMAVDTICKTIFCNEDKPVIRSIPRGRLSS